MLNLLLRDRQAFCRKSLLLLPLLHAVNAQLRADDVPFAPILQQGEQPFSMFVDLQNKYDWVLQPVIGYTSVDRLIEMLEDKVVRPAEAKFTELLARRTNQLRVENV